MAKGNNLEVILEVLHIACDSPRDSALATNSTFLWQGPISANLPSLTFARSKNLPVNYLRDAPLHF